MSAAPSTASCASGSEDPEPYSRAVSARLWTRAFVDLLIAEGKRPNFPMMPGDEVFVPERAW